VNGTRFREIWNPRQYAEMLVAGAPLSVSAIKEVVRETEKH
jgi:hypothetical protein